MQRVVTTAKSALERARRAAELEAPLNPALKRRLDQLPDDP